MRIKFGSTPRQKKFIITYTEVIIESFTCVKCGSWLFQHKTKCHCYDCKTDLCVECGKDKIHNLHMIILTQQATEDQIDDCVDQKTGIFTDPSNCHLCGMIFSNKLNQFAKSECSKCDFILCENCTNTIKIDKRVKRRTDCVHSLIPIITDI